MSAPGDPTPRELIVDALRMLAHAEIVDHSGHGSTRRDAGSFFINAGNAIRTTLTVDDIVAVDLGGNQLQGTARPPLEYHLHAEIYRARADVGAVLHTHPRWSTFLTMTGTPYQPVFGQGALLGNIPVLDSPLSVNTRALGERVAVTLGGSSAALLKSHGAVIVGTDMLECFALAAYLEENAHRQYMAMQIGRPYVFTEAEQQVCRQNLWSPALFKKAWEHYRSKLG